MAFSAGKERVMGLEPTTATLATWRSTTELHPRPCAWFTHIVGQGAMAATPGNYKSADFGFKGEKPAQRLQSLAAWGIMPRGRVRVGGSRRHRPRNKSTEEQHHGQQ